MGRQFESDHRLQITVICQSKSWVQSAIKRIRCRASASHLRLQEQMSKQKQRDSVPQYSYRQSLKKDEIKTYKKIALIIAGFFVILVIIWFMGTTFINALTFLSNGNTETTTKSTTSLPLQTPQLEGLPDATNKDTITVLGNTTAEVTVILNVNGKEFGKTKSDSSGDFKFESVKLSAGDNLLKVTATNDAKEKEETTATVKVDKTRPGLAITTPVDGASLPSSTKNINVSGTTEVDAVVYVNGSQAVVDSSGKFTYNLSIPAGVTPIEVTSTDLAGNITTVKLSVTVEGAISTPESGNQ